MPSSQPVPFFYNLYLLFDVSQITDKAVRVKGETLARLSETAFHLLFLVTSSNRCNVVYVVN